MAQLVANETGEQVLQAKSRVAFPHSQSDGRGIPQARSVLRERIYRSYTSTRLDSWEEAAELRSRESFIRKVIHDHFPQNREAVILDLGCGCGATVYFAKQAGYTVRGVDISAEQVAAARRLGLDSVEQGDVFEVLAGVKTESLDTIITFDVIEHFRKDELTSLVDEVFRALRQGGTWLINAPNGESPFVGRVLYGDLTHELAFTQYSLAQLMLASGFRRVECFENAPVAHGVKSAVRAILWRILTAGMRLWLTIESGSSNGVILSQNFLAVVQK